VGVVGDLPRLCHAKRTKPHWSIYSTGHAPNLEGKGVNCSHESGVLIELRSVESLAE